MYWLIQALVWAALILPTLVSRRHQAGCDLLPLLPASAATFIMIHVVLRTAQSAADRRRGAPPRVWPYARAGFWASVGVLVLAAVGTPFYHGTRPSTRVAKANADVRAIAGAVSTYRAQHGRLPESLGDLTRAGVIDRVPVPPCDWAAYRYDRRPDGTYQITSTGEDGDATVAAP